MYSFINLYNYFFRVTFYFKSLCVCYSRHTFHCNSCVCYLLVGLFCIHSLYHRHSFIVLLTCFNVFVLYSISSRSSLSTPTTPFTLIRMHIFISFIICVFITTTNLISILHAYKQIPRYPKT